MKSREHYIRRAAQAESLLTDPILSESLDAIKTAIREQVFALPIEASAERERLVMMDKIRQQFVSTLELVVRGGEISRHELDMELNTKARIEAIREKARNYAG